MMASLVINFSHPLTDATSAEIEERVGQFELRTISVQLDLSRHLQPQLDALVGEFDAAYEAADWDGVYIIPPALAVAAAYVGAAASEATADRSSRAGVIVLRRAANIAPVWELADIVWI